MQDRDVINRKVKEFLSGEKVDVTEMSVVFVYLLKMRSTLRIMEDLLEDIAYWQENGNLAKRNFEIENLETCFFTDNFCSETSSSFDYVVSWVLVFNNGR